MPQKYKLKNLYDNKLYDEVARFLDNPDEVARFSDWDYLYCINSLINLKRYFNARDLHGHDLKPRIGMKVQFTLVDKLDKSKGIVKPSAVEITAL